MPAPLLCRYEVQGEYVIPSTAAIPKSAAEMALMQGIAGQGANSGPASPFEQTDGRWRVQVCPSVYNYTLPLHAVQLTFAPGFWHAQRHHLQSGRP